MEHAEAPGGAVWSEEPQGVWARGHGGEARGHRHRGLQRARVTGAALLRAEAGRDRPPQPPEVLSPQTRATGLFTRPHPGVNIVQNN